MKIFNNKNKKISEGFTLIEALVSIALLMIAVMGPLTLTFNALTAIRQSKNRVVASYLAEEVLENFRNYRDNFSLSCSNLNINYNYDSQQISSIYCASDSNLGDIIPPNYYNYSTPPNTNPQDIAWKMFLLATMGDAYPALNTSLPGLKLDNDAFYFSPQNLFNNKLASNQSCVYLKYNEVKGYNCSDGDTSPFKRTVNLTKLSGNTLKVDVNVVYFESGTSLAQRQKSLNVTGYIYER